MDVMYINVYCTCSQECKTIGNRAIGPLYDVLLHTVH